MRVSILFKPLVLCAIVLTASNAFGELKPGEARKLIRRAAGSDLPGSSVRVKTTTQTDENTAEAVVEIETAFRLQQDDIGGWSVREVRTGPDHWESVDVITRAANEEPPTRCNNNYYPVRGDTEPTFKRARCLLAHLMGVDLPSDAVRIRSISALSVPLSSLASALVVANVQVRFRFTKQGKGGWQVSEISSGKNNWIELGSLMTQGQQQKKDEAMRELQAMSNALQKFRAERGSYVISDQQTVLMDHLTPYYLARVIRIDPWRRPYQYQGERDRFTIRSEGPDGKPNTPDDVVLSNP